MTSQFGSVRVRSRFVCQKHTLCILRRPTRAIRVSYQGITSVIHSINIYMYLYVLRFSYLDCDSSHQLIAFENFIISTRPSCHLTYCKTFTYINLKVRRECAYRIRRECAYRIRSEFEFSSFSEFRKIRNPNSVRIRK